MPENFQFMVKATNPPKVELTDAGLYVRFVEGSQVGKTVIQNEWPHIAVDLAESGEVIGIEIVPAPREFSIGKIRDIAIDARVGGLPPYRADDVRIENVCTAVA